MYSVRIDIVVGMIEVEVVGFWIVDEVKVFGYDVGEVVWMIVMIGVFYVLLCDYSKVVI